MTCDPGSYRSMRRVQFDVTKRFDAPRRFDAPVRDVWDALVEWPRHSA